MKKLLFLTMISCMFFCSYASAQRVEERGIGRVTYRCPAGTPDDACVPSPDEKDDALEKAKMNAIGRYFAGQGAAADALYERNEDEILDMMDRFILNETILNEQDRSGRYEVTVRVELNQGRLQNYIKEQTSAGSARKSQKSEIVYLFMGREVDSTTSRASAMAKIEEKEAAICKKRGEEGEKIGSSTIITTEAISAECRKKRQIDVEAMATKYKDQYAYGLLPMNNYDTSITSVFSQAGFSVIDSRFALSSEDIESVNAYFQADNDIAAVTYLSVAKTLQEYNVPYLVIATLDVDPATTDPSTGQQRVAVRTTVKAMDMTSRFPREVASVPVDQSFGLGKTDTEARSDALSKSSARVTQEIVRRLNVEDVR